MRAKVGIVVPALAALLLAAACTEGGSQEGESGTARRVPPETLLLGTDRGPLAVRVPQGSLVFERDGGVAAPDGSLVFSASSQGGSTELDTLDGTSGEVVSTTRIRGDLDVRVASGSGGAVALMDPLPAGWDPRVPLPRSRTAIVVADPSGVLEPRRYELRGNFEPEAFSTDDSRLFLIQHLPAEAPAVYRVTVLDLTRGRVEPVFGPFKSPPERMPGTRLQQVYAPDGSQLYTLYTSSRPGYAPHAAPAPKNGTVSFIHVLDLEEGWAHCVGLPRRFWDQPASHEAIAASPDGGRLYIADAVRGLVSVMETDTLDITKTATVPLAVAGASHTSARVSADGGTLFVGVADGTTSSISAIDTTTLGVSATWSMSAAVSGLGLSGDGLRLYVALGDRVAILDAVTGRELEALPFTSTAPIVDVSALPS
ncbi:MAG TPA: hypothetical protein VF984_00930 [Actinomycetota bacterium]